MRDYDSGDWGFSLIWGIEASVFPRAFAVAFPNAVLTFAVATILRDEDRDKDTADMCIQMLAGFTGVLMSILWFRSGIAYDRWWEGGTLLQKTRGEWFNSYSSLMAFTSPDPAMEEKVEAFQHFLARLMSLLFCCALQQVSPSKNRPFEILDVDGIDPESLFFLNTAQDKVEVLMQWVQRVTILNIGTGVLPIPPPILSRAFQEVSRGIVNLQNARKIADFPFPYPYAQANMVMLMVHWAFTPILCAILFNDWLYQRLLCAVVAFLVIFSVWCVNFIALQLESPFGDKDNDLPMVQMQREWNKSLVVLLRKRAHVPPAFEFVTEVHRRCDIIVSDGTLRLQRAPKVLPRRTEKSCVSTSTNFLNACYDSHISGSEDDRSPGDMRLTRSCPTTGCTRTSGASNFTDSAASPASRAGARPHAITGDGRLQGIQGDAPAGFFPESIATGEHRRSRPPEQAASPGTNTYGKKESIRSIAIHWPLDAASSSQSASMSSASHDQDHHDRGQSAKTSLSQTSVRTGCQPEVGQFSISRESSGQPGPSAAQAIDFILPQLGPPPGAQCEASTAPSGQAAHSRAVAVAAWQQQLTSVIDRIKETHCHLIKEELDTLSSFLTKSAEPSARTSTRI